MANQDLFEQIARDALIPYCIGMNAKYETAWHLDLLAQKLEDMEARNIKRLMIFMPPRHGKSFTISQYFSTWYLGRNPNHEVIFSSYSQEVASDVGRKVRNLMGEPSFRAIFPEVTVSDDSSAAHRFNTNHGGAFYAVGAGGPLTSRGANLLLIDDIHKNRAEAASITMRKNIHDWFGSVAYSRLMPHGVVVIVQTRWHEDDLPGRLLKEQGEQWEVLSLPALTEENGLAHALWPARYPVDVLKDIKRTIGTRDFESLYQQRPTAEEGNIIRRDWLRFYEGTPELEESIISVDATFTGKATSDFVAMQVWGRYGARKYLLDRVKRRMSITDTIHALVELCAKWPKANLKLIENKANGPAIEDLLKLKVSGIVLWEPTGDKVARMNAVSPQFEAGNVYLPARHLNPWVDEYIEEIVTFPNAPADDEADASTMALIRLEENCTSGVGTIRILR